jgi:hypothetical protein
MGYNIVHGLEPIMRENVPAVDQISFFSGTWGSECRLDFYAFRAYYAFFATLLTPITGVFPALLLVNWAAWAFAAWVTWKLSLEICEDRLAALLAVIFVAGGMGMVLHIHDYSSHLLSFTAYYLGVYLLYHSAILFERKPLWTHLQLGAYLAVACLIYDAGVMLTALYIIAGLRRNSLKHIAAGSVLALTARPFWQYTLHSLGASPYDIEALYLHKSLVLWGQFFQQSWQTIIRGLASMVTQFAFFDSPFAVVVGLMACWYLPRKREVWWFGAGILGIPLVSSLLFSPYNPSRGYMVYGVSIWIYCWLGRLFAEGLRAGKRVRLVTGVVVCLCVGGHFAWSTAHVRHALGPVKSYLLGWDVARVYFEHPRAEAYSLTGSEETPFLFGGNASLAEAGVFSELSEIAQESSAPSLS